MLIHFDHHIFQMGWWTTHQLDDFLGIFIAGAKFDQHNPYSRWFNEANFFKRGKWVLYGIQINGPVKQILRTQDLVVVFILVDFDLYVMGGDIETSPLDYTVTQWSLK